MDRGHGEEVTQHNQKSPMHT
uniref:Uncharacterized protein n=1 Tax=Anguilla anguilla TaxID=7936 RepID=A0A0E9PMZ1_ANGAN